jgi:predicted metal-dependent phosphoesterase TrpH
MRIDLHTHTTMSDGTDTPDELLAKARAIGLDVIAVTDHDTLDHLPVARAAARREGVELLEGLEMSCDLAGQSVHLLAYGMDPGHGPLTEELERSRAGRGERLPRILSRLENLGVPVSTAEVMAEVGEAPAIGRPHIADALVARGHVRDRAEAFDRFLADGRPAYVDRYEPDLRRGIDLIHAAGGLAVIAHPWGRGSSEVLTPEVLADLVAGSGLDGFEVDHGDHGPPGSPQRTELAGLAAELGVLGTGSSDYHGLGKPDLPLGCNLTDPEVYAELRRRLG